MALYEQTPEQLQNVINATGQTPVPQTINSSVLTPQPTVQYSTPKEPPIYPVTSLAPEPAPTPSYAPSPTEQKAQSLSERLQSLNDSLVGQSTYRAELEGQAGIPALTQTEQDLNARLKSLTNEALAIPLQIQQFASPGTTTAGIQPHQTAALRTNAIQALSTSALLDAAKGNLSTALAKVDRAVAQKFDPIKEQIAAATSNLKLILESPQYSNEQKQKAELQLQIQAQKAAAIQVASDNQKTIQGLAIQALQNNAPAAIVDQVMHAPDIATALKAMAGYGAKETVQSIQEYEFARKNGYAGSYTQYQNEDANRKVALARASNPGQPTPGAPTSYKEWELAGGEKGTGKSYSQWLADSNVKAPTVAQQTVATYAARIEQANPTIDNFQSYVSGLNPAQFEIQRKLPSYLQDQRYQQFDQAARNFINATLRRESGAVISPSEFDNAYKQYLPRAGDSAATLAQKKTNRDIVYASLKKAAGTAYQSVSELVGTPGSNTFTSSSGKTYTLPN